MLFRSGQRNGKQNDEGGEQALELGHHNKVDEGQRHCGYVDQELFPVTTYTMIRTMDLAAVTGERFKNWLKENNVELISYRDLKG